MRYILLLLSVFVLASCGGRDSQFGQILGLDNRVPDEFSVVSRAPLTLPPDFTLTPTSPDAREQVSPEQNIQQAIFGVGVEGVSGDDLAESERSSGVSEAEIYVLQNSESLQDFGDVRRVVDLETARLVEEDKTFVQDILGIGPEYGAELDAGAEHERLEGDGSVSE